MKKRTPEQERERYLARKNTPEYKAKKARSRVHQRASLKERTGFAKPESARRSTWPFIGWDGEGVSPEGDGRAGWSIAAWNKAVEARAAAIAEGGLFSKKRARVIARSEFNDKLCVPQKHNYTLLANSLGEYIESDDLGTERIFSMLSQSALASPEAIHVFYGGSYDVTMWLRDLTREQITLIMHTEDGKRTSVELGGRHYAIEYRPRKYFKLARWRGEGMKYKLERGKWVPDYDAKITLWDVIGFFQSPFVEALRQYGVLAPDLIEKMAAMKAKRSEFSFDDSAEIRAYCISECVALSDLMAELRRCLYAADLRPKRWDGAGAIASALLQREGVKAHIEQEPLYLIKPVACAFFGGRIEMMQIGRAKQKVWNYDIASAYPAAAANLPSLAGGFWKEVGCGSDEGAFALYHVRWAFLKDMPWYPLPYRRAQTGVIVFPIEGEGWVWGPEYFAALAFAKAHGGVITVLECWEFQPRSEEKPFGFVPELFEKRREYKRAKNGAQMAVKLALNSLYGKTAQQVGATAKKNPPFFALSWAGYITSATRARLVMAGVSDPGAIVCFATDGIYATRPLPLEAFPSEPPLGGWEGPNVSDDGVFVMAGVYWTLDAGEWKARYRGFDKEAMTDPAPVLSAWRRGQREISLPSTRFITYTSATISDQSWAFRASWRTTGRALQLDGNCPKRYPIAVRKSAKLTPTQPRILPEGWREMQGCSSPYLTFRLGLLDGVPEDVYLAECEEP